jgi:predicted metal-dependent HD superfamily phosphohydrolase
MAAKPGVYGIEDDLRRAWQSPGYWKVLSSLRIDRTRVTADGSKLRFTGYPFRPASVCPNGVVDVEQIAEINLSRPSQVRLKSGEVLFVNADHKEALLAFIHRNDVPTPHRYSIWGAVLEPFLDTWEEQHTIDRQFAWLATLGLDRETVNRWRSEVAVAMVAYNFGTGGWEWCSLALYDALVAQQAALNREAFADFYSRAMRLTALDPVAPPWVSSIRESLDGALFSVLIEWYPWEKGSLRNFDKRRDQRSELIAAVKQRLLTELTVAYSEPHRRYHTVPHVQHCLTELARSWSYAVHLNEVRWALLFHDAIYDPRRQDNEARSADWACRVMDELQRPEEEKARIREMILATAHGREPRTVDEALLLDIDLSILGADAETFDEYDRAIRVEYEWVPEQSYREARTTVLKSFLDRPQIYHTAPFRQRLESSARANLQRALARLAAYT